MLDTISYIPTIMAYLFMALLLVTLAFIVIYISHKIYNIVYDSLPLSSLFKLSAAILSLEQPELQTTEFSNEASKLSLNSARNLSDAYMDYGNHNGHKKVYEHKRMGPLKLYITTEPCYLAMVPYEIVDCDNKDKAPTKIIKYYDQLSDIPTQDAEQDPTQNNIQGNDDDLTRQRKFTT